MRSVALAWAWTLSHPEIDGGILDPSGRCFHFAGTLETMHDPITEITTWDELDSPPLGRSTATTSMRALNCCVERADRQRSRG